MMADRLSCDDGDGVNNDDEKVGYRGLSTDHHGEREERFFFVVVLLRCCLCFASKTQIINTMATAREVEEVASALIDAELLDHDDPSLDFLQLNLNWDSDYYPVLGSLSDFVIARGFRINQNIVQPPILPPQRALSDHTCNSPRCIEAFERLRTLLQGLQNSQPPHVMLISRAGNEIPWSRYRSELGGIQSWLEHMIDTHQRNVDPANKIWIRLNLGPGKSIVGLGNHIDRDGGSRAVNGVGPAGREGLRIPRDTGFGLQLERPPRPQPWVVDPDTPESPRGTTVGALPCSFFNLALLPDNGEIAAQRCIGRLRSDIVVLIEAGFISGCLEYEQGRFDVLEWLGDAILHVELTKHLIRAHSKFASSAALLTPLRIDAEQRLTLALLYDELNLSPLLRVPPQSWDNTRVGLWKCKGDIIEAMIGELSEKLDDPGPDGAPHGHPLRGKITEVGQKLAEYAMLRGRQLMGSTERERIKAAASAPGGGGFRVQAADIEATVRYRQAEEVRAAEQNRERVAAEARRRALDAEQARRRVEQEAADAALAHRLQREQDGHGPH